MHSLRRRLLAWVLPTCIGAAALASVATYWGAAKGLAGLLDEQLQYVASHVKVQGDAVRVDRSNTYADRLRDERMDAVLLQVWRGGRLEYTDDETVRLPAPVRTGFADVQAQGRNWHSFALARGDRMIQVAQAQDARWEALARVALHLLWPLLACIAALAAVLWFGIGRALRPVRALATELRERDADRLRPVSVLAVPAEIEPLPQALNDMLGRLEQAFAAQKRLVADAAHELRTPVMALMTQAHLAESAASEQERAAAVRQLSMAAARLARLTEQLLNMARLEPGAAAAQRESVDLAAVARAVVLEQADAAERKQIDLGLDAEVSALVCGVRDHLAILVRNLVDNAIRYTPPGGRVDVRVLAGGPLAPCIEVRDDGPGIPAGERSEVFERFRRGAGQREHGSGLGLAIVKRITQEHGGRVDILDGNEARGTCVRVALRRSSLFRLG